MRRCALIILLSVLALPAWAAQSGDACKGELWRNVKAWLKPEKTFEDTIAYLRAQKIDYAVFDARTAVADGGDGTQADVDPTGLTDCQPQKQAPQCSIVLSEQSPESKNAPSSPTFVESDELISIDFDAAGKQTGHGCEVVLTGM